MDACGGCNPCANECNNNCQEGACLRWGFDGCFLRGRCADGSELTPLDLCAWLKTHETCTDLSLVPQTSDDEMSGGYMLYRNECGEEYRFWVCDFLGLGSIQCLKDVCDDVKPQPCDLFVFDPACDGNPDTKCHGKWVPYHIPEAGDCVVEPDSDGYYKVLITDDCGCIKECKLPVVPSNASNEAIYRDSVPDDPDYPWYYGNYNEKINLHLKENNPAYFGKFGFKVTVNYGVQAIKSDGYSFNYNWRSILAPVIEGGDEADAVKNHGSILQNWAMVTTDGMIIPWGTSSLRGSLAFIVPAGKEAYLHHEYRIRTSDSFPNYKTNPTYDGKKVPDAEAGLDKSKWPASRLNALQVIVEPVQGATNYSPTKDAVQDALDAATDVSPQPF